MKIEPRLALEKGRDYAYRVIKENIVQLELEPGAMLSESELAQELGVSRTPVREALIDLAKVKIVEILPQRGCRVALIDYTMVDQAFFLREVMEEAIVALACEMATEEDILQLEENVKLQSFYVESEQEQGGKLFELDEEFHRKIYELCNKGQIYEMIKGLSIHTDRIRRMSLNVVRDNKTVSDHKDILQAIKNSDAEAAKQTTRKHLSRYITDKEKLQQQYPELFIVG